MKYISKNLQKYLTEDQKKEYKELKRKRNQYIEENPLKRMQLHIPWNGKSWFGVPTSRYVYYIKDPQEKEIARKHFQRIRQFCGMISLLEGKALENKELAICKQGNLLQYTSRWSRGRLMLVEGKSSRDYYNMFDINTKRTHRMKWTDITRYMDISDISK